jgi:probable HAF family extracellular repeat protein
VQSILLQIPTFTGCNFALPFRYFLPENAICELLKGDEMTPKFLLSPIPALSLLAALTIPVRLGAQPQPPRYTVTDLGTLGGTYSYAYGLNNAGVVAGGAATASQTGGVFQTAFLWAAGHIINVGTLGGAACPSCNSEAGGPNAGGESALISETSNLDPNREDFCGFGTHRQCLAAIWKNGALTALSTLPGGNNAQAYWINNLGEVIGFSENSTPDSTCATPFQVRGFQAVKWAPNGQIQPLSPLQGDTVSFGFGINDNGQAVGASGLCSNVTLPPNNAPNAPHAVLWERDGSVTNLGALAGGAGNYIATSVNNRAEVVGNSVMLDGTVHPFLWTRPAGTRDLGLFPGDFATIAPCCNTINSRGEIVGFSLPGPLGNGRAIVWQHKIPLDMNSLIPAGSPWYLRAAESINDAGEIVGWGTINGDVHAFLAKPTENEDAKKISPSEMPRAPQENGQVTIPENARFGRFGGRLIRRR